MPKRVLVVDDYPGVSLALKAAFRMDGRFELTDSAATAAEGLELLESQDAVLLDFNLPDMEGIDVVRAFRFRRPATPLILHSASDNTPEIASILPLVDAVVLKTRTGDLLAALARLTGA